MLAICLVLISSITNTDSYRPIDLLIKQWAPLIWLAPNETYFPLSVEKFLNDVHITNEQGMFIDSSQYTSLKQFDTTSYFLATKHNLNHLLENNSSILHGDNPSRITVPVYALVNYCSAHRSFHSSNFNTIREDISRVLDKTVDEHFSVHVTYWMFYPYNKGKELCFLGKVPVVTLFGRCFGMTKSIGNHVGDWERMSLSFVGNPYPTEMYISTHHTGGYYKYYPTKNMFKIDRDKSKTKIPQNPKLPPIVRMQSGHPVLFAAKGSHGLWSAPGTHQYHPIPKLHDDCGYGTPWKTWNDVRIFDDPERFPDWINFRGKWGNPQSNCVLFKKLGLCEHTEGPSGIIRLKEDFQCEN